MGSPGPHYHCCAPSGACLTSLYNCAALPAVRGGFGRGSEGRLDAGGSSPRSAHGGHGAERDPGAGPAGVRSNAMQRHTSRCRARRFTLSLSFLFDCGTQNSCSRHVATWTQQQHHTSQSFYIAECNTVARLGDLSQRLSACCMQAVVAALPDLTETVQVQLLDLLALVLTRKPYRASLSSGSLSALRDAMQLGEANKVSSCFVIVAGGAASNGCRCQQPLLLQGGRAGYRLVGLCCGPDTIVCSSFSAQAERQQVQSTRAAYPCLKHRLSPWSDSIDCGTPLPSPPSLLAAQAPAMWGHALTTLTQQRPSASHLQCAGYQASPGPAEDKVWATPHMASPWPLSAAITLVGAISQNGWSGALCAHAAG